MPANCGAVIELDQKVVKACDRCGALRRRCTSTSRTSHSWSTARQRYIVSPAIRATISSRCHCRLGFGCECRKRRAKTGPNFRTQRRTVS
jgi:hypothetical protein